jgi:hypothetical protein
MKNLRTNRFVRSFLLPFAAVLWLGFAGCTSWKDPGYSVEEVVSIERPYELRARLSDGSQIEVKSPRLESDSLIGVGPKDPETGRMTRVSIPLTDVVSIEVKRSDGVKTAALVVGTGALVIGGIALIASATESDPPPRVSSGGGGEPISCPLVYSWDGTDWRLDSGTFGGAFLEPLARTDVDNLEFARVENGRLRLRLANELPETDHVDALDLLVVDHAPGTEVIPDGAGGLHTVGALSVPIAARDDHGRDALATVRSVDGWGWESSPTGRDPSVAADTRSALELEFSRPPGATEATLVVHGSNTPWAGWLMQDFIAAHGRDADTWYAAMNADREAARALGEALAREAFLSVSVETAHGWEPRGLVWEVGPEIAKRQALRLDLAGIEGETVRVRLESVPLYWNLDQVGIDFPASSTPTALTAASTPTASSEQSTPALPSMRHIRIVEPESARMESDGQDVRALLSEADGIELVLETGDAAVLAFQVPPVPEGMIRSYLIATTGWYRIHSPVSNAPPRAEVARIGTEPGSVSRLSVARLNEALEALNARAARGALTALGGEDGR